LRKIAGVAGLRPGTHAFDACGGKIVVAKSEKVFEPVDIQGGYSEFHRSVLSSR